MVRRRIMALIKTTSGGIKISNKNIHHIGRGTL
jgi:hypothetical protein